MIFAFLALAVHLRSWDRISARVDNAPNGWLCAWLMDGPLHHHQERLTSRFSGSFV
jgi:hypothetical protein